MPAVNGVFSCRPSPPNWRNSSGERSRAGVIKPTNPIDLGDIFDFTVYTEIMAALCRDPEVDAVLLNYGPMADFEMERGREMARQFVEQARAAQKPLAVTVLVTLEEEEFFRETLGVPVFHFPEEAVEALAASRYLAAPGGVGGGRRSPSFRGGEGGRHPAPAAGFSALPQALSLIGALGIAVAPWGAAATPDRGGGRGRGAGLSRLPETGRALPDS